MEEKKKCECGKVIARWRSECRRCADARHFLHTEEAKAIVKTGKCPQCGSGLKRNIALAGWWQCEQYGSEQFRKDPLKPICSFQTFTE